MPSMRDADAGRWRCRSPNFASLGWTRRISSEHDELVSEQRRRVEELRRENQVSETRGTVDEEVDAAMALFERLERVVDDSGARAEIADVLKNPEPEGRPALRAEPKRKAAAPCDQGRPRDDRPGERSPRRPIRWPPSAGRGRAREGRQVQTRGQVASHCHPPTEEANCQKGNRG